MIAMRRRPIGGSGKGADIRMEEFIRNITEQIRCVRAREAVAKELSDHILDQAAAYEEKGEEHETALGLAIREMGDPVAIGVELDRIHRPQTDVKMIVMVLLFSIGGMLIQYMAGGYELFGGTNNSSIYLSHLGRQILILFLSFGVMMGMYFLDYGFIGRYASTIYWVMTLGLFVLRMIGREVNGRHPVMLMLVYLYIPVYAGMLYQLRGKGGSAIVRGMILQVLTTCFAYYLSSILHAALAVYLIQMVLLILAICKGWFQVNKRDAVIFVVTVLAVIPLAVCLFLLITGSETALSYRLQRIQAWLHPEEDIYGSGYTYIWIRQGLAKAKLIGTYQGFPFDDEIVWGIPRTDPFILLQIIFSFGILAGFLVIAAFAALIIHVFGIVKRQKNQLGFMIAAGCFMVVLDNCVEGILINSGYYPVTSLQLPFLSFGVGSTITYAILIGLLLSIYRNEKIITDYTVTGTPSWRLSVRWEKK